MLTDTAVKTAKLRENDYKLADSGGLYLFVTTKGHKSWRLNYRSGGKERHMLMGEYPTTSLRQARELGDGAKLALRKGRDPSFERRRAAHVRRVGHEDTG